MIEYLNTTNEYMTVLVKDINFNHVLCLFHAKILITESKKFHEFILKNTHSGNRHTTNLKLYTYCEETGRHAVVILPSGKI